MPVKCAKCHFDNPENTVFCGKCGGKLSSSEDIPIFLTKTIVIPKEELTTGTAFAGKY